MKNTILSKKDADLIEKAIVKHGRILTTAKLIGIFKEEYSHTSAHNRINRMAKAGWLKRIKQGLYLVTDSILARSHSGVSAYSIANSLEENSYVSLSYALNYYQMYDQYEKTVTSITKGKSKKYIFEGHTYVFSKVKTDLYFGFVQKRKDGKLVKIAEAEKALVDYLYLNQDFSGGSIVFEKIKKHHRDIDLVKLQEYAARTSTTVLRKIGLMLDSLNLDSEKAFSLLKEGNKGVSFLTSGADNFNAKWRIYYDDRIIR